MLHQKKHRDEEGVFIAEGPKVVLDLFNSKFNTEEVFATHKFKEHCTWSEREEKCAIHWISEKELESISALATPNQVLAIFKKVENKLVVEDLKGELVLALDDIRDPGNLGTIIRNADWFGITHILCSESCVDVFNPKVIQATMGSLARVNVYYVDLDLVLNEFNMVYAAVLEGNSIYSQKLSSEGVVLIGNESKGISERLMKRVNRRLSIPKFPSRHDAGRSQAGADSLNAAVATAIICSEFRRR